MRIQFIAPDPRAGTTAQMDSSRGQQLIDGGAAVQVQDTEAEASTKTETERSDTRAPAAKRPRKAR